MQIVEVQRKLNPTHALPVDCWRNSAEAEPQLSRGNRGTVAGAGSMDSHWPWLNPSACLLPIRPGWRHPRVTTQDPHGWIVVFSS